MKTQTNRGHSAIWSLLVGFTLVGAVPATIYAETQVSNPGSGPDIFMAWTNPGDPIQITDFTVDFSDPANPDVQLKTGDTTWNVRSQLGASLGNIGNITLDPTVSTANFDLTIANGPFDPGAANVGSLNLTAAGWTGHSSLGGGKFLATWPAISRSSKIALVPAARSEGVQYCHSPYGGTFQETSPCRSLLVRVCT